MLDFVMQPIENICVLQNNPLYIKCFVDESGESALKFHYIVHCALDAVEEKGV